MNQRASCEPHDYRQWADKAIPGEALTRDEARAVLNTPDAKMLSLLDAASDARRLKEAGVDRINHNLNSSERFHSEIVTTHTYQDRLTTIRHARAAGLEICSGGIAGMGEADEDLIDLAFALREVAPHSIPMNFLHPVEGTPMESRRELTPQRCLKILCLFRFLHPRTELRIAGGREFNLRSLQALALYPADSLFVGGYLTTPGMPADEAWRMIEDLGLEVEVEVVQPVGAVRVRAQCAL